MEYGGPRKTSKPKAWASDSSGWKDLESLGHVLGFQDAFKLKQEWSASSDIPFFLASGVRLRDDPGSTAVERKAYWDSEAE